MSVRRAGSAVRRPCFLSGAYLGNRMTYLDDIWYVGEARSEVAHAKFWAWQVPIKYLICIIYAKKLSRAFLGNHMPHLDGIWYVGSRGESRICKKRGPRSKGGAG